MTDNSVFDLDDDQKVLYNDIYTLITPYVKPKNPSSLLMTADTLLAVAVQLYTAMYKRDEEINEILENAKEALPKLRESIEKNLQPPTVH